VWKKKKKRLQLLTLDIKTRHEEEYSRMITEIMEEKKTIEKDRKNARLQLKQAKEKQEDLEHQFQLLQEEKKKFQEELKQQIPQDVLQLKQQLANEMELISKSKQEIVEKQQMLQMAKEKLEKMNNEIMQEHKTLEEHINRIKELEEEKNERIGNNERSQICRIAKSTTISFAARIVKRF